MPSEVEVQRRLLDAAGTLIDAADRLETPRAGAISHRLRSMQESIPNRCLRIALLGEFGNGKSTLINSLFGQSVLPMGLAPAGRIPAKVAHGRATQITLVYEDGARLPASSEELQGLSQEAVARLSEIQVDAAALPPGVSFVDTPGMADMAGPSNEAIHDMVLDADTAVCVLNCDRLLSLTEQKYIQDDLLQAGCARVAFILNRADGKTPEEVQSLIDRARHLLGERAPDAPVLPYAALQTLQASIKPQKTAKQAVDPGPVRSLLLEEWPAQATHLRSEAAARRVGTAADNLDSELADLQESARVSLEEAGRAADEAVRRSEEIRNRVDEIVRRSESAVDSIRSQFLVSLKEFALGLRTQVPKEVMEVPVEEARRHLSFYIQDALRRAVDENEPVLLQAVRRITEALPTAAVAAAEQPIGRFQLAAEPPALPLHLIRERTPLSQGSYLLMAASGFVAYSNFPLGLLLLSTSFLGREVGRALEAADRRASLATGAQNLVMTSTEIMEQALTSQFEGLRMELASSVREALAVEIEETERRAASAVEARRQAEERVTQLQATGAAVRERTAQSRALVSGLTAQAAVSSDTRRPFGRRRK